MHVIIGTTSVLIGIYTLSWAWTLAKRRKWVGVVWTVVLAFSSMGLTLFYLFRHGFYP